MLIASTQFLTAFLLVFARISGLLALIPVPGLNQFPPMAKAALALLLTFVLLPSANVRVLESAGLWSIAAWTLREAGFGLAMGVALQFLTEMLGLAAQLLGFQAGYSYVNSIDPSTQVDAAILNVMLTLTGGLLFFALDLHLQIVRALAWSLQTIPVGPSAPAESPALAPALAMVRLGGAVFESALRLAFPIISMLLLLDLALALLSYVNARMQLLSLAFPVKMLVTMLGLSAIVVMIPPIYQRLASQAINVAYAVMGRQSR